MRRVVDRLQRAWNDFFFTGYRVESLGALRVAVGVGFLLFQLTQVFPFFELRAGGAWRFLEPIWYFAWLGIERLQPVVCWTVLAVWLLANVGMIVGLWSRTSIALVLLTSIYLKGARDSVVGDTHHRLLIWAVVLFFLWLSDSGRAYSLDALRLARRARRSKFAPAPPSVPEWCASWPIRAMQLYTASFYVWSVIAKLRVSGLGWFMGGGKLQEILLRRSAMWGVDEHGQALGNELAFYLAHQPRLLEFLGVAVLLMEASFPLVLFIKSTRARVGFLLLVAAFHVGNFLLLYVGFVLMPLVFVIFFDMDAAFRYVHARVTARRRAKDLRLRPEQLQGYLTEGGVPVQRAQ